VYLKCRSSSRSSSTGAVITNGSNNNEKSNKLSGNCTKNTKQLIKYDLKLSIQILTNFIALESLEFIRIKRIKLL